MDTREAPRLTTSETLGGGMMVGPTNSYGGASGGGTSSGNGVPSNNSLVMPPSSAGMMSGMRLSFNHMPPAAPVSRPMDPPAPGPLYQGDATVRPSTLFNLGELGKKKRGRPRKYGPDGSMALALSPLSSAPGYSNSSSPMTDPSAKRRGRPPGSGKKQQLEALGSAGIAFTPHVITVKAGEDVASKIMAFSQQGSRTVCILSANGAISNVTLRQPATSGGTVTYEGRFEIISLSGSYLLTENNGTRSRTGGLSVALAGSDGRVLGGGVAGMLMAAAPVQVVVGSFIAEGKKPKPEPLKPEPSSAPPQVPGFGAGSVASPPSRGTSSESSDDLGSPVNHSGGVSNNSGLHVHSMPSYTPISWSHTVNQHRHDSDMKMMP